MNYLQNLYKDKLCAKLVSSLESPITFDEKFKVISLAFFIPNFDLLSCKLDNFTFKVLFESFYIDIISSNRTFLNKYNLANKQLRNHLLDQL